MGRRNFNFPRVPHLELTTSKAKPSWLPENETSSSNSRGPLKHAKYKPVLKHCSDIESTEISGLSNRFKNLVGWQVTPLKHVLIIISEMQFKKFQHSKIGPQSSWLVSNRKHVIHLLWLIYAKVIDTERPPIEFETVHTNDSTPQSQFISHGRFNYVEIGLISDLNEV